MDDEGDLIREQVRRLFADEAIGERLRALLETAGEFDRTAWVTLAELGWLGTTLAEEDGGLGLPDAMLAVIAEEIGRTPAGIPFGPTIYAAAHALSVWGAAAQRARWLPRLIAGEVIGAFAFAEHGEGGLPALPATALRDGALFGAKVAVAAGAYANFALVPADVEGEAALYLVDLDGPGVERTPLPSFDNSLGFAALRFEGAAAVRLDAPADAAQVLLNRAALFTAFEQIGGSQACLDAARDYALERRVFGQPIGAFQGIKHKLADMYAAIQVARGAAAAALLAPPPDRALASAAARHAAIKAYDLCAQENIQVHGGIGVTWEAPHHLHYRRARCLALEWGGAPYWRERVVQAVTATPSRELA